MESVVRNDSPVWADAMSGVSWASIAAGAVTTAALSLALLALGVGLGLSSISPWADSGVSAATFKIGAGIYLVVIAVMSSAIGGYLAARLRTRWTGLDTNEVFFRDTAHGFVAWAFATVISASVLGAAAGSIVGGTAAGIAPAAQSAQAVDPSRVFVDRLFRQDAATAQPSSAAGSNAPGTNDAGANATGPNAANAPSPSAAGAGAAGTNAAARAEVTRLWTSSFKENGDLAPADRTYVAHVVAMQTGMSQADAEKRVNDVVANAKAAADRARIGGAKLAFWLTAALLFGAFAASLAAVEGGQLRDGAWNGRRLVKRAW